VVATNYFDKNALIQQVKSDQIKDIKDIKKSFFGICANE